MQEHNETKFNRYSYLWDKIKDERPATILSYGCSTGEELITANAYFPHRCFSIGYDSNPVMIRIARQRFSGANLTFNFDDVLTESYDLILCNSVLCNHPKNENEKVNKYMTFKQFSEEVKKLDSLLRPGGILMMMNAEYILSDFLNYQPIGNKVNHKVTVFNKEGMKTDNKQYALWRKSN